MPVSSDTEYAAHCPACDRFGVSTTGTTWTKAQFVDLVETHVSDCIAEEIDVVERDADGEEIGVVETVTAGVSAQ